MSGVTIPFAQLAKLQNALIDFITKSAYLFQANKVGVWAHFYELYPELKHLQTEHKYDAVKLRDEFINFMLPTVYSLNLTELQQSRLKLFEMHPLYVKTPEGYALKQMEVQSLYCREPMVNFDYQYVPESVDPVKLFKGAAAAALMSNKEFSLYDDDEFLDNDLHTLAMPTEALDLSTKFEAGPATNSVLSAIVSNDLELASNVVHDPNEVKERLADAKETFEQSGEYNNGVSNAMFLEKLQKVLRMRKIIEKIQNGKCGQK